MGVMGTRLADGRRPFLGTRWVPGTLMSRSGGDSGEGWVGLGGRVGRGRASRGLIPGAILDNQGSLEPSASSADLEHDLLIRSQSALLP